VVHDRVRSGHPPGPRPEPVTFLGGPLGFWFAQNGAIYIFWVLILVYAVGMNRLDHEFDVEEDR
jgi:putative solute:sodium symporter small subunit